MVETAIACKLHFAINVFSLEGLMLQVSYVPLQSISKVHSLQPVKVAAADSGFTVGIVRGGPFIRSAAVRTL